MLIGSVSNVDLEAYHNIRISSDVSPWDEGKPPIFTRSLRSISVAADELTDDRIGGKQIHWIAIAI
jgi:hypothetical protein